MHVALACNVHDGLQRTRLFHRTKIAGTAQHGAIPTTAKPENIQPISMNPCRYAVQRGPSITYLAATPTTGMSSISTSRGSTPMKLANVLFWRSRLA